MRIDNIEPLQPKEPHADFQKGGLLHEHGDLEAAIYSVAYGMIALKRVRMGYHANLNNSDAYADKLEDDINDTVERFSNYLLEENVGRDVASCANTHLLEMAKKLGVNAKGVPDFVKNPTSIEVMLSDMPIIDITKFKFNNLSNKTRLVSTPDGKKSSSVDMSFRAAIVPPETKQRDDKADCATSGFGIVYV